jgi:hypothetical protein
VTNRLNRALRGATVAFATATLAFVGLAGPAQGTDGDPTAVYNNAELELRGGDATALSKCVQLAKAKAKVSQKVPSQKCQSFAKAEGGTVALQKVSIFVDQEGGGARKVHNKVDVKIVGGDATAVSSCLNYIQDTHSAGQQQQCASTAVATGGDVILKEVDITVFQLGG